MRFILSALLGLATAVRINVKQEPINHWDDTTAGHWDDTTGGKHDGPNTWDDDTWGDDTTGDDTWGDDTWGDDTWGDDNEGGDWEAEDWEEYVPHDDEWTYGDEDMAPLMMTAMGAGMMAGKVYWQGVGDAWDCQVDGTQDCDDLNANFEFTFGFEYGEYDLEDIDMSTL